MWVYVVQGRHGELYVSDDSEKAFDLWAETNGFSNYIDFLDEWGEDFEFSENHWYLDDCGQVNRVKVL